jgi:hypothetical protein
MSELGDEIVAAIEAVIEADAEVDRFEATEAAEHNQRRKEVYGARKAARGRLVLLHQKAGLNTISFGREG